MWDSLSLIHFPPNGKAKPLEDAVIVCQTLFHPIFYSCVQTCKKLFQDYTTTFIVTSVCLHVYLGFVLNLSQSGRECADHERSPYVYYRWELLLPDLFPSCRVSVVLLLPFSTASPLSHKVLQHCSPTIWFNSLSGSRRKRMLLISQFKFYSLRLYFIFNGRKNYRRIFKMGPFLIYWENPSHYAVGYCS